MVPCSKLTWELMYGSIMLRLPNVSLTWSTVIGDLITNIQAMNLTEFQRLRNLSHAEKAYRSFFSIKRKSKRSIKGKGKAVGQILKTSRVEYQVRLS